THPFMRNHPSEQHRFADAAGSIQMEYPSVIRRTREGPDFFIYWAWVIPRGLIELGEEKISRLAAAAYFVEKCSRLIVTKELNRRRHKLHERAAFRDVVDAICRVECLS